MTTRVSPKRHQYRISAVVPQTSFRRETVVVASRNVGFSQTNKKKHRNQLLKIFIPPKLYYDSCLISFLDRTHALL